MFDHFYQAKANEFLQTSTWMQWADADGDIYDTEQMLATNFQH